MLIFQVNVTLKTKAISMSIGINMWFQKSFTKILLKGKDMSRWQESCTGEMLSFHWTKTIQLFLQEMKSEKKLTGLK